MKHALCLSLLLFISIQASVSQSVTADTSFVSASINNAVNQYAEKFEGEIPLYNGTAYSDYNALVDEHPYFLSNDWIEGAIRYDNDTYEKIALQFDIRSPEKVVIEHATSGQKVQLINERISFFTLGSHRFIRLEKHETDQFKGAAGFYEVLVPGQPVTLFAKHVKTLQKRFSSYLVVAEFETITKYYFRKDGRYYPVKGKKSVMKVLSDEKNELRRQMKKNRTRFSGSREHTLIESAKLYNQIKIKE
jgi:hypothetical protein